MRFIKRLLHPKLSKKKRKASQVLGQSLPGARGPERICGCCRWQWKACRWWWTEYWDHTHWTKDPVEEPKISETVENVKIPPLQSTHLQLMSDWMTVSVQEEDQRGHLIDGAGMSGCAAHAQTVLHLHTHKTMLFPFQSPPTHTHTSATSHTPGRSAWTWPSVRSDRRAWSRPGWGSRTLQTAAWTATPGEEDGENVMLCDANSVREFSSFFFWDQKGGASTPADDGWVKKEIPNVTFQGSTPYVVLLFMLIASSLRVSVESCYTLCGFTDSFRTFKLTLLNSPPVLKVFSRRLSQLSLKPPPEHATTEDVSVTARLIFYSYKCLLTKNPAQNGQDCLTRAEEVKAILVKEKARTMAPRPMWQRPRYRSSRAPLAPLPDIPLRLSDQPRDPETEAMLLESDGEGMTLCMEVEAGLTNQSWAVCRKRPEQQIELRSVRVMQQTLQRW